MSSGISRRRLLAFLGTTIAGLGAVKAFQRPTPLGLADGVDLQTYLPGVQNAVAPTATLTSTSSPTATGTALITPTTAPTVSGTATPTATGASTPTATPSGLGPKVVHVHSASATHWDFASGWYGDYVDQAAVDHMVEQGMMELTRSATAPDAWRAILPAYGQGQKIAIKINLNNASCDDWDNVIDALPQPVNSVIKGLKAIGVAESDIWVYDVTNGWHVGAMPARLVSKIRTIYPGVQFHSASGSCSTVLGYSDVERIRFGAPAGKPPISDLAICNALVNATYLINMPIMKKHVMAGVTLGFKNHFGSFDRCDSVHWSTTLGDAAYTSRYNALVDIYNNRHFKEKTVLTVADALYGARIDNHTERPSPWPTFGNQPPNSLLLSTDPVAIDCVMCDLLEAEGGIPKESDAYLKLAAAARLGVFERGQPWGVGYNQIGYTRLEL